MLKKLFKLSIFVIAVLYPFKIIYAQASSYEHIQRFDTTINVNTDGSINISEKISYFFPFHKHGIIREIPLTKTNQDGDSYRMLPLSISVTNTGGKPYMFQDNSTSKELVLKIGDPNRTIIGSQTYLINYTLTGALTYFSDHDELYWNSTGNEWLVPILESSSKIILPSSLTSDIQGICYTGPDGSTKRDCSAEVDSNKVTFKSQNTLEKKEGLTVAVSFPKGVVFVVEPVMDSSGTLASLKTILISILVILYTIVLPAVILIRSIKKLKKHPNEKKVVAAWFDPPKTPNGRPLTAGEVGVLYDRKGDVRDITASLIQLAQKGYIKITSKEGGRIVKKQKFSLTKMKDWNDPKLLQYERYLLDSIFKSQTTVELDELGKRIGFATKLQTTYKEISKQLVTDKMFEDDPYKTKEKWVPVTILGFFFFNLFLIIASIIAGKASKRTPEGALAWATVESLKNFVKSQEKQLEFQAKNQMFFEKLLPFATALGIEKIWIERFNDIKLAQPEWLETADFSTFVYLNMMSSFNSSVSKAVSTSSTRSSSGFSSGFSGGFSGGGGGGGGGGSW